MFPDFIFYVVDSTIFASEEEYYKLGKIVENFKSILSFKPINIEHFIVIIRIPEEIGAINKFILDNKGMNMDEVIVMFQKKYRKDKYLELNETVVKCFGNNCNIHYAIDKSADTFDIINCYTKLLPRGCNNCSVLDVEDVINNEENIIQKEDQIIPITHLHQESFTDSQINEIEESIKEGNFD